MQYARVLKISTVAIIIFLSGCGKSGKSVEGQYTNGSTMSFDFKPDGNVVVTNLLLKTPPDSRPYTLEGNKITIKRDSQSMILTINDDGSLGWGGGTFKKAN